MRTATNQKTWDRFESDESSESDLILYSPGGKVWHEILWHKNKYTGRTRAVSVCGLLDSSTNNVCIENLYKLLQVESRLGCKLCSKKLEG